MGKHGAHQKAALWPWVSGPACSIQCVIFFEYEQDSIALEKYHRMLKQKKKTYQIVHIWHIHNFSKRDSQHIHAMQLSLQFSFIYVWSHYFLNIISIYQCWIEPKAAFLRQNLLNVATRMMPALYELLNIVVCLLIHWSWEHVGCLDVLLGRD